VCFCIASACPVAGFYIMVGDYKSIYMFMKQDKSNVLRMLPSNSREGLANQIAVLPTITITR
jgi:hypothetical protein